MLISLKLSNFRSFRGEQTFDLIASRRLGEATAPYGVILPGTQESVLRLAALYGANGAGKSNLVKALGWAQHLVLRGTELDKPIARVPFRLDEESGEQPTLFEVRFLAGERVLQYGFSVDSQRVHEEWLDVFSGSREQRLFARVSRESGEVEIELGKLAKSADAKKIGALAEVGARANQLFLAEVVNLGSEVARGKLFHSAAHWFASSLAVIAPDASFQGLPKLLSEQESFAEFASTFLKEANTGVDELRTEVTERRREVTERRSDDPETTRLEELAALFETLPPKVRRAMLSGPDGEELLFTSKAGEKVMMSRIMAQHRLKGDAVVAFPLAEESDGTRRLLHLLPALHKSRNEPSVFVIDELERSMHPALAHKLVEYFLNGGQETASQLLFTTHETHLLDLDLMRRDSIWFVEKDQEGASTLYSLADFKVRKDLRIEKGYLQGRFGAIPFLGGIDRLMEMGQGRESR